MKKILGLLFFAAAAALGQSNFADPMQNQAVRLDGGDVTAAGTVTSVNLSAPAQFTVTGVPILTFGTLGLDWNFSNWAIGQCLSRTGTNTTGGAACSGGGTSTTGTGFWHNTAGALDAASRAVDVSTADVTGLLPFANIANGSALSLFGRSTNSAGVQASITAAASSDCIYREQSSVIGCGTIASAGIGSGAVTYAKLQNTAALAVIGNATNSSAVNTAIACTAATGNIFRESGSTIGCSALPVTAPVVNTTGTISVSNFVASGGSAAAGLVPTPGATAGSDRLLKEDATFSNPFIDPQLFILRSDWCGGTGDGAFTSIASGTGATTSYVTGTTADIPCAMTQETGTTTTGYHSYQAGNSAGAQDSSHIALGGGAFTYMTRVMVPTLSDGTDTYSVRVGLCDLSAALTCVDGVTFSYVQASSTFWRINACSNSVCTTTNTANTVTANQWDSLKITCNAAATSCNFFVNGTEVSGSPLSTNIPTGATRATQLSSTILKSAGTTNRTMQVDYTIFFERITAAR